MAHGADCGTQAAVQCLKRFTTAQTQLAAIATVVSLSLISFRMDEPKNALPKKFGCREPRKA